MLIDNRQRYITAYPVSSPKAFGSGELKSIKSVQACMMNISIKSQPNIAYDFKEDTYSSIVFPSFLASCFHGNQ